jgi:class 3 adenylate cyclase/tetratricopeptide (TPR) repeat protein
MITPGGVEPGRRPGVMVCEQCGSSNETGRKFCGECGTRLALACSSCGTPYDPRDKFCGECGSPVTATQGRPGAAAPGLIPPAGATRSDGETERRLVSVLFVDLVGFTTFSEGRDAEDVRAMLSRYFDAASDAVARHGGSVEKFIGDAVMAVWGTPVAHEDDAERAVRSALEIVDQVGALGAELGLPLKARAGVLTGEAVAALGATDQGFVTGDLVNTASRLQSAAEPGAVFVGERTQRATTQSIAYEPVEPLTVKGKAEPVPAFRALRLLSERGGGGRGNAPEPPFVGRDEQLRMAKELLHATGREGRPRLLHISGVAGIGKSRLVWELLKYLDGLTDDVYWHTGRCPSYGDGVNFWALAEMVRLRAGIADTDDAETSRAALAVCLADYVVDPEERHWMEPRLGHLLGLDPAPSGDRDELFGAWRRFFERVAERGTVALVVEDLHWADPGLMDFLESMLEASRTSPILVLTMARPELMDRRPTWGHGVRSSSVLHLDRLDDDQIREMVTGYVEGLPEAGLQRLVDRAEGVPMYAVETVRMLADRGVLEQRETSYVAVGELGGELDIPETLHALVAARLDGLPDAERGLVQDSSVAGQSFTLQTVSAVAGLDPVDVEPLLRQLVRKEVLEQDLDPRSPERGQYQFVQSVIREVAYSTLSKSARRAKHLACARWLTSLGDEDLVGIVASHYLEAYRADPSAPDSETVAADAREWLSRASERALSLGSPELVRGYVTQALELAGTPEERGPLHDRALRASVFLNDIDAVWAHYEPARDSYLATGAYGPLAEVLTEVGAVAFKLPENRSTQVREDAQQLLAVIPDEDTQTRIRALSFVANQIALKGDYERAGELTEQAMTLAQMTDDDEAIYLAAGPRASVLTYLGRHWESMLLYQGRLEMARRSEDPAREAAVLANLGLLYAEDDPRKAVDTLRECVRLSVSIGDQGSADAAMFNAIEIGVDVGEWEFVQAALAEYSGSENLVQDDLDALAFTRCMLLAHHGQGDRAHQILADLEPRYLDSDQLMLQLRTWFLRSRSYVHVLAGRDDLAAADAALSLELDATGSNALTSAWTGVQAASGLRDAALLRFFTEASIPARGRWARQIRRTGAAASAALEGADGAVAQAREALDGWLELGLPLDHAFATDALARALPPGSLPDEHVGEARAYLIGLGAVALLRRLDEATGAA